MKRNSVLVFVVVIMLAACNRPVKGKNGVVYSNAITYNDYIVNRQTDVMKLILKVSDETKTDINSADQTLNTAVALIDKSITEIEGMPDWKGDTTLRNSALNLFKYYKKAFGTDFRRIIAIQKDSDVSEAEEKEYDQLVSQMGNQEEKLDADFQRAQETFSSKNGMLIKKNEIQDKIDKLDK